MEASESREYLQGCHARELLKVEETKISYGTLTGPACPAEYLKLDGRAAVQTLHFKLMNTLGHRQQDTLHSQEGAGGPKLPSEMHRCESYKLRISSPASV